MKLGIVGLPNVGKSTLFNALTKSEADSANYPFCTIDPNVGIVPVPDSRLKFLTEMYSPQKVTPATVEFVDIAGLVKGASKGEGLGNKFLANIRESTAIVHVVRCFDDENIVHVEGNVNPIRDIETIDLELIYSDIEILERRIDKSKKAMKGDKKFADEVLLLENLLNHLNNGKSARSFECDEAQFEIINTVSLLSLKPVIFAANLDEKSLENGCENNKYYKQVADFAKAENAEVIPVCAKIEQEIAEINDEEKEIFLKELNLNESGLDRLIRASYHLLGYISFLTAGVPEVRAWTIVKGTKAPQAAGVIHSDIERGFIRAETISFNDLTASGSMNAAKEKGLVRSEGKSYEMQDGDVVYFRFNV